jgi:hypothetical protein
MSRAYRCDRCGSYFTRDDRTDRDERPIIGRLNRLPLYGVSLNHDDENRYDLCLNCAKELYSWITEVNHERNEEHD